MEEQKKLTAEETLAEMKKKLIMEAWETADRMNEQAGYTPWPVEKDFPRNQVNSGVLIGLVRALNMMGCDVETAVWDDGGYSVCEFVRVGEKKIYTRSTAKEA